MKVLITGGAGFIGSHIVDEMLRLGHPVRILDCLDPQVHPDGVKPKYVNPEAEWMQEDIRDIDALEKAIQGQEIIFHQASAVGMGQSQYRIKHYVDVNTGGMANLLEILANRKHCVQKLIVSASQTGYGEGCCVCPTHGFMKPDYRCEEQLRQQRWEHECPDCGSIMEPAPTPEKTPLRCKAIYAITKRDQEDMALSIGEAYGIPVVSLRYFNVYGPRQSLSNPYTGVMAIFMSRLANGNPPVLYEDGLQTRDFISVHDIVTANRLSMENDAANGQILNVGNSLPISIRQVAEQLSQLSGNSIEPQITSQYRQGDTRHCTADISKIQTTLNFQPAIDFTTGLKEWIEWSSEEESQDHFEQAAHELAQRGLV